MSFLNAVYRFFLGCFILFPLVVFAAEEKVECKGQAKNLCLEQSKCTWVKGFERKDGIKVNAYCRTSPGAKKSSSKVKAKPSKSADGKKASGSSSDTEQQKSVKPTS